MKSMTGYAWAARQDEQYSVSVEIRGYNNRFLDISVSLPPFLSALESRVRERAAARFRRGKIEVFIKIREYNTPLVISINRAAVASWNAALETLAEDFALTKNCAPGNGPGSAVRPPLETLLHLDGILETEKVRDSERCGSLIESALDEALDSFEAERLREGKHTEKDILSYIEKIEKLSAEVAARAPEMDAAFREHLRSRFRELLDGEVDEARLLAETAVFLVKASVAEELSRLAAHLAEFRRETAASPAPGKKLDFLAQEINREINTIGSKSPDLAVGRAVVDMKDALENIREQLRNVE
ncbi:MAG: YicC family protein [Spirochaetaceae bacterium]|jgi:uncharacterized protein (TIGR00255 family)|nr:YicC family protein [Spirochaetaceae bacterium]